MKGAQGISPEGSLKVVGSLGQSSRGEGIQWYRAGFDSCLQVLLDNWSWEAFGRPQRLEIQFQDNPWAGGSLSQVLAWVSERVP